jgi:4-amino-4-deoxychorismate lyase
MCHLIESLLIENKEIKKIEYHNNRFNESLKNYLGLDIRIDLEEQIKIPEDLTNERYKCRVIFYDGKFQIEFTKYIPREIKSCKVVYSKTVDYTYKTTNRDVFNRLFNQRGECDDIIIIKNGFVTDSFSSNIIFYNGKEWVTPDTPLLKGTQRQYLIDKGFIKEERITDKDILKYSKLKLINAMLDFERAPEIKIPSGILF